MAERGPAWLGLAIGGGLFALAIAVAALLVEWNQSRSAAHRSGAPRGVPAQNHGVQRLPAEDAAWQYETVARATIGESLWQHWGSALALAMTPDERTVISLGSDGELKFWDIASGREKQSFTVFSDDVPSRDVSLALSLDGGVLAISTGTSARCWRLPRMEEIVPTERPNDAAGRVLALSPDGRQVVFWQNSQLNVRDTATGESLFDLEPDPLGDADDVAPETPPTETPAAHTRPIASPATSGGNSQDRESATSLLPPALASYREDGRYLAVSNGRQATVWDLATQQVVDSISPGTAVVDLAFTSPNTVMVAGPVHVGEWDLKAKAIVRQFQPPRYSPDITAGRMFLAKQAPLVALMEPAGITVANIEQEQVIGRRPFDPVAGPAGKWSTSQAVLAFSASGRYVIFDSVDLGMRLWEPAVGRVQPLATPGSFTAVGLHYSPDGKLLALFSRDGRIRLADPLTGRVVRDLNEARGGPVALSGDWQVYAGLVAHGVAVWDRESGELRRELAIATDDVQALALSDDGQLLASSIANKVDGEVQWKVQIWDVASGQLQREIPIDETFPNRLLFHPDSRRLALLGDDDLVQLDTATGEPLWEEPQQAHFRSRHDRRGRKIVVQTDVPWLRLVDAETAADLLHLGGANANDVVAANFSADESLLAGCDNRGQITLWELPSTEALEAGPLQKIEPAATFQLGPKRGRIFDIALAPDGKSVAVACGDGVTRVLTIERKKKVVSGG